MSLSLFADHCVPTAVIHALSEAGHHVSALRDHLPKGSDDDVVIAKAQEMRAILISLNGDFADIVTYPPRSYLGIIALQVHDHPEVIPSVMQRLLDYLSAHPDQAHYAGVLLLVEPHRIRIRR
jgi:predicted nuclease of predicted toxin-antitoxin system